MPYNREKAVAYAHRWAYSRNPKYYNFDNIGGDCSNFVSQCLYEGCNVMNHTPDLGWYYTSASDRSAAWSGVEYLYHFLLNNSEPGPYASVLPIERAEAGDIIQLTFGGGVYTHTVIVVETGKVPDANTILIASHTFDSDNRPLDTYEYENIRLLHIEGVNR